MSKRSRRNVGVPKFLRYLYKILEREDPNIISWTPDGLSFSIFNRHRMEIEILPKYYKHSNISSLNRQLNYFGIRRMTQASAPVSTYSHPYLVRGNPLTLKLIKRRDSIEATVMIRQKTYIPLESISDDDVEMLGSILFSDNSDLDEPLTPCN